MRSKTILVFARRTSSNGRLSRVTAESSSKMFSGGVSFHQARTLNKRQITGLATASYFFDIQKATSDISPRRFFLLHASPSGGWEEDNLCCGEQDDDGT